MPDFPFFSASPSQMNAAPRLFVAFTFEEAVFLRRPFLRHSSKSNNVLTVNFDGTVDEGIVKGWVLLLKNFQLFLG